MATATGSPPASPPASPLPSPGKCLEAWLRANGGKPVTLQLLEKVFLLMGEPLDEDNEMAENAANFVGRFGKRSSVVGILLMLLQDSARELTDEQRQARIKRLGDFALPNESLKLGLAMIGVGDNSPLGRDLWDFGVEFHCSCTLGDLFEKYKEERKRMQEHMRQLFSMPVDK